MRFAFIDPPYLGQGKLYRDHPDWRDCDRIDWHASIIARADYESPDGWAYCLTSTTLQRILPVCPEGIRVAAWVKPFASFKPNVPLAYAWEPVIFSGGRKRARAEDTRRDWLAENIALKKGLTGAKPHAFNLWVLDSLMGFEPGDSVDDYFPGTGGMSSAVAQLSREPMRDFALVPTDVR